MRITLGQLDVAPDYEQNLDQIGQWAERTRLGGGRLMVLPEGIIARDPNNPNTTSQTAQPLDGPFVTGLREISIRQQIAIAGTVHTPLPSGRVANIGLLIDHGIDLIQYQKLHLYDAFTGRESDKVDPGHEIPPVVQVDDFTFGLMTCYDVRFPEMARALVVAGAEAILLPAAWVRGSLKEDHWRTLVTARALENTCYVLASGEISARNIGRSMVVDPLGVTIAAAAEQPTLVWAELDKDRVVQAREALPVLANRRFADPILN